MSQQNPWDFFLKDSSLDNEFAFRNLLAFSSSKRVADLMYRGFQKNLIKEDEETRDIILLGRPPARFEHPNLYDYANDHYKKSKAIDNLIKFQEIQKECMRKKYFFWRNAIDSSPETKEGIESQQLIKTMKYSYTFNSQLGFVALGTVITFFMGLHKNNNIMKFTPPFFGLILGTFYGEYKYSNQIFDSIPSLNDPKMEKERLDTYNYCYSTDFNMISKAMQPHLQQASDFYTDEEDERVEKAERKQKKKGEKK